MKASRLFVALLLFRAATAGARMEQDMGVRPDSGVKITLGSCFDNLSLAGFAPVDVTINNHSGEPRKWVLEFSSPGYTYGNMDTISSTFVVTAEDNGTRTIPLLVPATDTSGVQMPPVQVRISGYGVDGSDSQQIGARSWNGKKATAFVAISESLGTKIWSDLQKHLDDNGRDLIGSTVNPDDLPEDWRGLTGVAALWLRQDEFDHLDPAQRNAIQTWVHTGGQLMLCGAASVPGDMRFPGFGAVTLLPASLDIEATRDAIDRLPRHASDFDAFGSPQRALLAAVSPNVPLLSSFMAIFAFVIGPFNIYALARRRRERLFWTTPLISLGASGLLVGMIVIQDGAGGHGVRGAMVCIFPQSRTAVVAQEQLSRTGLLFNSSFETRDPAWIEQLGIQRSNPSGYNPDAGYWARASERRELLRQELVCEPRRAGPAHHHRDPHARGDHAHERRRRCHRRRARHRIELRDDARYDPLHWPRPAAVAGKGCPHRPTADVGIGQRRFCNDPEYGSFGWVAPSG